VKGEGMESIAIVWKKPRSHSVTSPDKHKKNILLGVAIVAGIQEVWVISSDARIRSCRGVRR
jgi:hypothetical protein